MSAPPPAPKTEAMYSDPEMAVLQAYATAQGLTANEAAEQILKHRINTMCDRRKPKHTNNVVRFPK